MGRMQGAAVEASPEVKKAASVVAKLRKVGTDRAQEAATTLCALSRVAPEAIKEVDGFIYVVAIVGSTKLPMRTRLDAVSALGILAQQYALELVEAGCVEPLVQFSIRPIQEEVATEIEAKKASEAQTMAVSTLSLLSTFPLTQREVVTGLARRLVTSATMRELPTGTSTVGGKTATSTGAPKELPKRPATAHTVNSRTMGELKGRLGLSAQAAKTRGQSATSRGGKEKGRGMAPDDLYDSNPPVPMQNMGSNFKYRPTGPPTFPSAEVNMEMLGGGRHADRMRASQAAGMPPPKRPKRSREETERDRRERVAQLLMMLCHNEENIGAVARALEFAEIHSLVDMARENHRRRQSLASELLEIAVDRSRLAIAGAGGIPVVVDMAVSGHEEKGRERMVKILRKLTAYADHRAEIVRQLARQCGSVEGNEAKLRAAKVILSLKAVQVDARAGVIKSVIEVVGHLLALAVGPTYVEETRAAARRYLGTLAHLNADYRKAVVEGLMFRLAGGRRSRSSLAAVAVGELARAGGRSVETGQGAVVVVEAHVCRHLVAAGAVHYLVDLATLGGVEFEKGPDGEIRAVQVPLKGTLAVGAAHALRALWCLAAAPPSAHVAPAEIVAYELLKVTSPASVDPRNPAADPEQAVSRVADVLEQCFEADGGAEGGDGAAGEGAGEGTGGRAALEAAMAKLDEKLGGGAGAGGAGGAGGSTSGGVTRRRRLFGDGGPGEWGVAGALAVMDNPDAIEAAVAMGVIAPGSAKAAAEDPPASMSAAAASRVHSEEVIQAALTPYSTEALVREMVARIIDRAIAFNSI